MTDKPYKKESDGLWYFMHDDYEHGPYSSFETAEKMRWDVLLNTDGQ